MTSNSFVIASTRAHVLELYAAGCQLEPVGAFIFGADVVVPGPRSFSYTTPSWLTRKVMTPEDWYSAGYATRVRLSFVLLRLLASVEFLVTIRK